MNVMQGPKVKPRDKWPRRGHTGGQQKCRLSLDHQECLGVEGMARRHVKITQRLQRAWALSAQSKDIGRQFNLSEGVLRSSGTKRREDEGMLGEARDHNFKLSLEYPLPVAWNSSARIQTVPKGIM